MDATGGFETTLMRKAAKVTQACARCRQKKNRCDGKAPSCSKCVVRGEECVYRGYQRKRGPGRSKQHMRALEQRLSGLEALLMRPNSPSQNENNTSPQMPQNEAPSAEAVPRSSGTAARTEEEPPAAEPASRDPDLLQARVENLDIIETAQKRLPPFKMATDDLADDHDSPTVAESLRRIPGLHIPVRQAQAILVENTIQEICDDLPLFYMPTFIKWLRRPESLERRHEASQWACLNATVALSLLIKTINRSYTKVAQFAWAYIKNAYAALPEMMTQGGDMWGVQAGIVMAVFMLRASGDTRAAAMLLSVAIRTMQTGALQSTRPDPYPGTRSRVFWAAYVLDTEISLNCGIPPILHDEDIDSPLPRQGVPRGTTGDDLSSGLSGTTVFALRAELATIQARIRKQLYAAKAYCLSDDELIQTVAHLASALDTWRSNVPTDVQPGRHGETSDSLLETPVIMLHLSYYNSVSMVHWAVRRHSEWAAGDASGLHQEQMAASAVRVKTATKVVVPLLPRIKSKPLTEVWRILPYLLAPGITFLALILEDLALVQARLNLRMIELLVQFLEELVKDEGLDLRGVLKGLTEMQGVATEVVNGGPRPDIASATPPHRHLHALLRGMTHPMLVAQALLGDLPSRDTAVARSLSAALSMPWEADAPFSPWVPTRLHPETYGFKYDFA